MSKQAILQVLDHIKDVVQSLSDQEVQSLLSGKGKLQFVRIPSPVSEPESHPLIEKVKHVTNKQELEALFKNVKKDQLTNLCESLAIEIARKETKAALVNKIASYFHIKEETIGKWQEIEQMLNTFEDFEQAMYYIVHHPNLKTNTQLKELAKKLDVYFASHHKKADIQTRIVESFVGAKLRAKGIRDW